MTPKAEQAFAGEMHACARRQKAQPARQPAWSMGTRREHGHGERRQHEQHGAMANYAAAAATAWMRQRTAWKDGDGKGEGGQGMMGVGNGYDDAGKMDFR